MAHLGGFIAVAQGGCIFDAAEIILRNVARRCRHFQRADKEARAQNDGEDFLKAERKVVGPQL